MSRLRLLMSKIPFGSFYWALRAFIAPDEVCIYPVSCSHYVRLCLQSKPFYISIPLIIFRLLSCNPITGIIRHLYFRARNRHHTH